MSKQTSVIVNDLFRGFHKVIDMKTNTFEYLTPEALKNKVKAKNLKVQKVISEPAAKKQVSDSNEGDNIYANMNKTELFEIASRYGFDGDVANPAITKKVLIAHIENEQTK